MQKSISEEGDSLHFQPIESSSIPFDTLLSFLETHYNSKTDKVQISYELDYLKWFFSEGGVLGVLASGSEWIAIFCVGAFLMRYKNSQSPVFNSGPLCVNKNQLFKNYAQKIVNETSTYIKNKYKNPILGAGVTGIKKDAMFKGFGMYLSKEVKKPSSNCYSSNNFFLCDDGAFLKKFENKEGFLLHYPQNIKHKNKNKKWGVIVSYYTTGCWKKMIYDFNTENSGMYDKLLIFENSERKGEDLEDIGFEKFTSYNLYLDSPHSLPQHFLYYNLFLF